MTCYSGPPCTAAAISSMAPSSSPTEEVAGWQRARSDKDEFQALQQQVGLGRSLSPHHPVEVQGFMNVTLRLSYA